MIVDDNNFHVPDGMIRDLFFRVFPKVPQVPCKLHCSLAIAGLLLGGNSYTLHDMDVANIFPFNPGLLY